MRYIKKWASADLSLSEMARKPAPGVDTLPITKERKEVLTMHFMLINS